MSSAPAESAPAGTGALTSGAASSGVMTSAVAGSMAPQSSPAASGSADGKLDADSAAWFSALCTGQAKPAQLASKLKAATQGSMSDADKAKAASPFLTETGKDFIEIANTLSPLPPPGFTGGADYATKQIGSLKEKGDILVAAGKATSSGDPSKLISLAADQNAGPQTTALNAVKLPAGVGTAIKALPACAAVMG
ncbi:hypothetical protein [Nakamurella sp. PAMC28650]|jgi:hypothetical protein|uniref:hypothetical protein n=1 Tax=Nakamurella sp. PAMC28650 TaxID=2762325 RepID=UPI00164D3EF4|nr:hypothetical protein [Nakamurella sp. PAMC28650]QNK79854.1 hypothetical protein H7F38_16615 [Nakamurella sp. PAMC28650]